MEDGASLNVSELAKESTKKEATSRIPRIPLMILAPLLVVIALAATIIPNTLILENASQESVQMLSSSYLQSMMQIIVTQTQQSVERAIPALQSLMGQRAVRTAMTTNFNDLPHADVLLENMLIARIENKLDGVSCFTGRWAAGYGNGSPVNATTVDTTVVTITANVQAKTPAEYAVPIVAIMEDSVNKSTMRAYPANPLTHLLYNPNTPVLTAPYDATGYASVRAQLGPDYYPYYNRTEPVLSVTVDSYGTKTANMFLLGKNNASSPYPDFTCSVSIGVESTWNYILYSTKPTPDSIIVIFGQKNLSVIATSGKYSSTLAVNNVTGLVQYEKLPDDEKTLRLRQHVLDTFGVFNGTFAPGNASYEANLFDDEAWIVNVRVISFGIYDDGKVLLVSALPRKDIFGQIDAAHTRSIGVSVGIAVGMSVLTALTFALVALPLAQLARAMKTLTQLDFAALEKGKVLEARSLLLELYNVQVTFSTMVKAFAGGIKKNKEMVIRNTASASQSRPTTAPTASR
ncbi:hypothetical protein HK104_001741 [Borealophlyctis nickersoniae]|nr:hypothetical protein HK104_001741 [Borealophlyctis nickersoniae]